MSKVKIYIAPNSWSLKEPLIHASFERTNYYNYEMEIDENRKLYSHNLSYTFWFFRRIVSTFKTYEKHKKETLASTAKKQKEEYDVISKTTKYPSIQYTTIHLYDDEVKKILNELYSGDKKPIDKILKAREKKKKKLNEKLLYFSKMFFFAYSRVNNFSRLLKEEEKRVSS